MSKAFEVAPEDRDALLVNIELGLSDETEQNDELIAKGFELLGRDPTLITLACARATLRKRYDEALQLAKEGLEITPTSMPLFALKTQTEISLKDFAASAASIAAMADHGFHAVTIDLMRARMLIAQEKLDDADTILNRLSHIQLPQGTQPQLIAIRELLAEAKRNVPTESP